jgi:hypothetical protein
MWRADLDGLFPPVWPSAKCRFEPLKRWTHTQPRHPSSIFSREPLLPAREQHKSTTNIARHERLGLTCQAQSQLQLFFIYGSSDRHITWSNIDFCHQNKFSPVNVASDSRETTNIEIQTSQISSSTAISCEIKENCTISTRLIVSLICYSLRSHTDYLKIPRSIGFLLEFIHTVTIRTSNFTSIDWFGSKSHESNKTNEKKQSLDRLRPVIRENWMRAVY